VSPSILRDYNASQVSRQRGRQIGGQAMGDVRIGTSGWNYPSGPGTWRGIFYPTAHAVKGHRVDELSYYAEHFNTVEVNASFYRPPEPATTRKWAERTPSGFDFSLKLFQKFTHPAMFRQSLRPGAMPDAETSPVPAVSLSDVEAFKAAIDPLTSAGKLGALLAQFPPSFRDGADTRAYLDWLLRSFKDYPMVVELRHRSWSDRTVETVALLGETGAAWAQIDEPKFSCSIRQDGGPRLPGLYYMRLHGRNADKWWTHDHPDERYNYLYSSDELTGFADRVNRVRHLVRQIYVYMNNHFAAKAVANAATLSHQLGLPVAGTYSNAMLERYGFLRDFVSGESEPDNDEQEDLPFGKRGKREGPAGGAESNEDELTSS
jgi:uncharacterized protein YecE (DUF72 family)